MAHSILGPKHEKGPSNPWEIGVGLSIIGGSACKPTLPEFLGALVARTSHAQRNQAGTAQMQKRRRKAGAPVSSLCRAIGWRYPLGFSRWLRRGDRPLTPHKRLSLTFATDFGEAFKPTDPIVRIGGDALCVGVRRELLAGRHWKSPGLRWLAPTSWKCEVGARPGGQPTGRRDWPGST
jgi:hypothetical protein